MCLIFGEFAAAFGAGLKTASPEAVSAIFTEKDVAPPPTDHDQKRAGDESPRWKEKHADKSEDLQADTQRILFPSSNDRGKSGQFAGKPERLAALRTMGIGPDILFRIAKNVTAKPATAGKRGRTQCTISNANRVARKRKSTLLGEALEFGGFVGLVQPGSEFLQLLIKVSLVRIIWLIAQERF